MPQAAGTAARRASPGQLAPGTRVAASDESRLRGGRLHVEAPGQPLPADSVHHFVDQGVLAGFFLMFLLERASHAHAHHTSDDGCCDHDHGDDHDPHRPVHHHGRGRWAWCGAFAGLALHSLADGAALAASVRADATHGVGLLAGLATFLAILLHKPLDAGIIATLMIESGASPRMRTLVNAAYAAVVPLGAAAFLISLPFAGGREETVLGIAMALAAGAFICIAAADLLPEVQFHSHDRVLLTTALALGLALAWGMTVLEKSSHAHAAHAAGSRDRGP